MSTASPQPSGVPHPEENGQQTPAAPEPAPAFQAPAPAEYTQPYNPQAPAPTAQPQPQPQPAYQPAVQQPYQNPAGGYQQQPAYGYAPQQPAGYPPAPQQYGSYPPQGNPNDTGSFGWAVLGFFFPIVGLILWLVWKAERPNNARKAGVGALVGFILALVFYVLFFFIGIMIAASQA